MGVFGYTSRMPNITFNHTQTKTNRRILRKEPTPQEVLLWSRLRMNQLGVKFRRQHGIGPYIVDFFYVEKRIVDEVDGSQHYEDDALVHDAERTKFLESQGCIVLRFTNAEINTNIAGVLVAIADTIDQR